MQSNNILTSAQQAPSPHGDALFVAFKYILDFYYGDVGVDTIHTILAHDKEKAEIEDFARVAKDFALSYQELELTENIVGSHIFPVILTCKEDTLKTTILTRIEEGIYELYDPLTYLITQNTLQEIMKVYNTALYFYKDVKYSNILDPKYQGKEWFWKHLKNSMPDIIKVGVLTVFINIFMILVPMYTMNVYNRVIPNFAIDTLFVMTVGVVLLFIFDAIFKTVRIYILENMGRHIGSELEDELFKRLLLVQSSHDSLLGGSKANLFRELTMVRDFFMSKSIVTALDFPFVFLTLFIIALISPVIAGVTLFCAILIIITNILFQIPVFNLSRKLFKDGQVKHNYLFETIKGVETIKITNATSRRMYKWRQMTGFYDFVHLKVQMLTSSATNVSYVIYQIATVLTVVIGVYEIQDRVLSMGGLIALSIFVSRVMGPIIGLSSIVLKYKEVKESLDSLNKFWHLPLETEKASELGVKRLQGEIEFNNISFSYAGTKNPSMSEVTFKIKPGEKVGFIGPTGAGKSTILRLLTGMDTPQSGTIFIDSHEINTFHPVELRNNIGVMPQEPFLFAGTLKENVEIGKNLGKEKLIQLLKMTGLEDLIKRSGEGENFQVGEGGSRLSVGQRHLVGLARSLVNDPPILILDEPTTGMDVSLEKEMIKALKPIVVDKTLILITHRFAALELVDRVMVVNAGKIIADGPRDVILAKLQGQK
ncbi:MAG: ATP-binding cassette domain-containing protein [Campylobacteraceae bacterium]|nr:ATP-binding cassette domain-containing protein [Campylobacteraceae bacterium]